MEINLSEIKKAHFIGIGGIGVSAIARLLLLQGKSVTGSDRSSSPVTAMLQKLGAKINFGHNENNLEEGTDTVIYTIAVDDTNPEFAKAKKLGIKNALISRGARSNFSREIYDCRLRDAWQDDDDRDDRKDFA
jgi:UDP-N-acetylmuramate-alanine ligase